ncbi:hypothetical protein [Saccharothrix hoggarensis]|uniref:hypothetical protein n=1 Tax=Saccharothrix hoggarensis TaxID=913853 RepID=UPI0036D32927
MPRLPKNFRIAWVTIDELAPIGYLETGPDTAVPTRFQANFALEEPDVAATMEVFVGTDLRPVVLSVAVKGKAAAPVTTSVMRQILVDQLVRAAVEKATVPASVRDEWLATLPLGAQAVDRREASSTADERVRNQADDDARRAARIYSGAVAAGNRAPAVAVANVMNRSRTQAARYIRRARELGLLPPLGSSEGA